MRNTGLITMAAGLGVVLAMPALAQNGDNPELTVDEIVEKTNYVSYYQSDDGRADVKMTIVDSQERERHREFTILRRDAQPEGKSDKEHQGDQKFYVYFHRPADVNKMVFMVHKHIESDDDRWLYLPALDLVKRISAADKRTSFVGSHFYYEDVSGRHIDADKHELVETTDNYYVLKNTPKDKSLVEFAYFKMWIHKGTFVVVKTEYYDAQDKKYRTYEAKKVDTIEGFPTVTQSRMTDHRTGGYTDMSYSEVKYGVGLPDDVFTERYLRKPPRKYLR